MSIIMPTLNEQAIISTTLLNLQPLRQAGHEIIVVDGGSCDNTLKLAQPFADKTFITQRGRAQQMNAGAQAAQGEILVFLHADTQLPITADSLIINGLRDSSRHWGRFDVRLSGTAWLLRIVERLMNWRSCITGMATGDQALFMYRTLYEQVHGFPDIPLMEDLALSRQLKRWSKPLCIPVPVITSSRRWEQRGIMRTILLMGSLRFAYALGVSPYVLHKYYR